MFKHWLVRSIVVFAAIVLAACASDNAKTSGKQLKKVVGKLTQFSHRLRSNNSRKNIPEAVREPLAQDADGIKADANTLKGRLSCTASPGTPR